MRKQQGFSLIELLIVVAIILIIAAIAIPNLMKARIAANHAAAVQNLRTIVTSSTNYQLSFGGYAPSLLALGGPTSAACVAGTAPTVNQACLIDPVLANAIPGGTPKSGYFFTYKVIGAANANGSVPTYTVNADPALMNTTGDLHYFVDQSGVVRSDALAVAAGTSNPI
jgi:prepilin-type N-terminal cleavage/methylation domain-containing protein